MIKNNNSIFDNICKYDNDGIEYWSSRDLYKILDYSDYRNFIKVIEKAKETCSQSGLNISDHFVEINEMVSIGSGAERSLPSIKLSRYACLLIFQMANSSKPNISDGLQYFTETSTKITSGLRKLSIKDELSNFLLYTVPDGNIRVEAILSDETIWLNQEQMSQIFAVQTPAISKHLKNIFESSELNPSSVISVLETTASDGKKYNVNYYNLDAIISVGYRVNSSRATQFRIWATNLLKEFIIKGYIIDDERLKNGRFFGKDYFEELLERVRSIRASERRIYQKITDIFQECSIDYDKNSIVTRNFFAEIQNKFHFAITGHTAPEIIYQHADSKKEFMGLTTWKYAPKGRVLKSDVTIAKNYLSEKQISELERLITSYFDYIEMQILRHNVFTMEQFSQSIVKFLNFNEFDILNGKGIIRKEIADKKAHNEYEIFNKTQKIESDFDKAVKNLKKKK